MPSTHIISVHHILCLSPPPQYIDPECWLGDPCFFNVGKAYLASSFHETESRPIDGMYRFFCNSFFFAISSNSIILIINNKAYVSKMLLFPRLLFIQLLVSDMAIWKLNNHLLLTC